MDINVLIFIDMNLIEHKAKNEMEIRKRRGEIALSKSFKQIGYTSLKNSVLQV